MFWESKFHYSGEKKNVHSKFTQDVNIPLIFMFMATFHDSADMSEYELWTQYYFLFTNVTCPDVPHSVPTN